MIRRKSVMRGRHMIRWQRSVDAGAIVMIAQWALLRRCLEVWTSRYQNIQARHKPSMYCGVDGLASRLPRYYPSSAVHIIKPRPMHGRRNPVEPLTKRLLQTLTLWHLGSGMTCGPLRLQSQNSTPSHARLSRAIQQHLSLCTCEQQCTTSQP